MSFKKLFSKIASQIILESIKSNSNKPPSNTLNQLFIMISVMDVLTAHCSKSHNMGTVKKERFL